MKRDQEAKKTFSKLWVLGLLGLLAANVIFGGLLVKSISEEKRLEEQFRDSGELPEEKDEIEIMLPEVIYAAKGITMEIYHDQVTSLGEDIARYNVCWKCEIGENLERRFSVTADESNQGSYELTLEIYDNALNLLTQKSCTLEIVEGKEQNRDHAQSVTEFSEVPEECREQVRICVDEAFNGVLEDLKPEGVAQMQDVIYSVLSGR